VNKTKQYKVSMAKALTALFMVAAKPFPPERLLEKYIDIIKPEIGEGSVSFCF
jgi:hypothetical protein